MHQHTNSKHLNRQLQELVADHALLKDIQLHDEACSNRQWGILIWYPLVPLSPNVPLTLTHIYIPKLTII
jgi:hypothetical protein